MKNNICLEEEVFVEFCKSKMFKQAIDYYMKQYYPNLIESVEKKQRQFKPINQKNQP